MMQVGKPVTGKESIGRQKEALAIIQYLAMGHSVVLIAPRRFGKTSSTLKVIRQLKQANNYTAFLDVFAHANRIRRLECVNLQIPPSWKPTPKYNSPHLSTSHLMASAAMNEPKIDGMGDIVPALETL